MTMTAEAAVRPGEREPAPGLVLRVFRTPLLTKLVLMDLVVNVFAFVAVQRTPPELMAEVTVLSLAVVLVLNAGLVAWALRPLQVLEETARRVSEGEFEVRTRMPRLADRNLVRIGRTLDALLDRVVADRVRVRALAAEVVATGDRERARIARELHDGTAQSLSALEMLLASTLADDPEGPARQRLLLLRDITGEALAEVRALAHTVHPRVLDDLGLPAALEFLARRTREQCDAVVSVRVDGEGVVPVPVDAVLYRVAQEAMHNAVKHGRPGRIEVHLALDAGAVRLSVRDDGVGFERREVDTRRQGMGLFVMEERVSLVDGTLAVRSSPGRGTEVLATIPLPGGPT